MKSSDALRKGRSILVQGTTRYVCHALVHAGGRDTQVYKNLQKLFNGAPVDNWLYDHSRTYRRLSDQEFSYANWNHIDSEMKLYRLRWIDWMIEGYEAVGD